MRKRTTRRNSFMYINVYMKGLLANTKLNLYKPNTKFFPPVHTDGAVSRWSCDSRSEFSLVQTVSVSRDWIWSSFVVVMQRHEIADFAETLRLVLATPHHFLGARSGAPAHFQRALHRQRRLNAFPSAFAGGSVFQKYQSNSI